MKKKILVLHGPNLNLLGMRETAHYGTTSLITIEEMLTKQANAQGIDLKSLQSNHEGVLLDAIAQAKQDGVDFLIFNPAAFTHTSIALRDALLAVALPFIEVHLSNIYARESFRHHSYFSDIAKGVITGLGKEGYILALQAIITIFQTDSPTLQKTT
jgi:3-dehydroquinate dehydratase-2